MHLYVHIPFCARKCAYCGFYSVTPPPGALRELPGQLVRELDLAMRETPIAAPETLYLGGGTPSLLGAAGLEKLASLLGSRFPLRELREWTVEANPASATPEFLRAARRLGVTRLSIGVQSFNDAALARAGRLHSSADARAVIRDALALGFDDVGIDLIAGLPGDSAAAWRVTLAEAARLPLRHVSVYALTLEPGTPLARAAAAGRIALPGDSAMLDLLAEASEALSSAGFERYELSNYALPGFVCRYNLAVWRGFDYLGIGPASASRIGLRRWTRRPDLAAWADALAHGLPPPASSSDSLSPLDDATERAIYQLRLAEGMDFGALAMRLPVLRPSLERWRGILAALIPRGIAAATPRGFRLTPRGLEVCDSVLAELV